MPPVLTGEQVLRGLRWALPTSVVALLLIGIARTVASQPSASHLAVVMTVALLFIGVYALGLRLERRRPAVWLAAVTALWAVLLVLELTFTWLAFPLFFLHMHLLRIRHALLSVAVLTGAVVLAQWFSLGRAELPALLGPVLGAGFAVVVALAYQGLYAENRAQQAALEELRKTREQLSVSQRRAGALAEREHMARDIHDTLAQGFSSVVLLARSATASLTSADYRTSAKQIDVIRSTASENLEEARRFVRALQSGREDGQPLADSLRRACHMVETDAAARGEALRCRLVISGSPVSLAVPHGVALLRTAQASLSNVVQHAEATTAVITVSYTEDQVMLDIVDDGIGFDRTAESVASPRADGTGFGLRSARERLEALGGEFHVESAHGEGTAVSIRLPLNGNAGE